MELKIVWTDFAKKELRLIFEYHRENANPTIERKLVSAIAKETLKLKNHPEIGQEEELLKNDTRCFRYLVFKDYKIIYLFNQEHNQIEIFDVFDTRQNPIKTARTK